MFTNLKRIIKSGTVGFYRNVSVSISAILIIAIALFTFASLYMGSKVLSASITQLEQKVDINVYFTPDAPEQSIQAIKRQLERINQVSSVEYITRDEALERFKASNAHNQEILDSLEVLEDNPLGASFNISAKQISQYGEIASFLDEVQVQDEFVGLIDTVNYNQNKKAIDKIRTLIDYAQQFGVVLVIVLSLLSVIIVYNTIRLTIYTVREEVSVMRLVGASKFFARGPFVIEGVFYGIMGAVLALAVIAPALYYAAPYLGQVFVLNIFDLFLDDFWLIFGSMLAIGVFLGLLSSVLAIRRYLDI
ncbi:MAG: cell division protein FtsX [Patescibacteria group bacterium]